MVSFSFTDRVAIITGAGVGIGFEIARQLASAGASVVLNDIDEAVAEKAAITIRETGGKCTAVPGDSSKLGTISKLIEVAVAEFGRVDFAVVNAGITTYGEFLEYEVENFQRLTSVNLQGSFFLAQAAARRMIEQKSGGRIVFMSSVTGHQAHPNLAAYGMTKAALEMLAKSLGVELASRGITVNAIAPGATMTERTRQLDPAYEEVWKTITPTHRVCSPTDISNAILFLLADTSRQITGQSIVVDGGWTAVSPPPE